jgi:hypothetical protein
MDFRTPIKINEIQKPKFLIDYQSNICLMGSCFVENIGQKLEEHKLSALVNPYGILFHPLAIESALNDIYHQKVYEKKDLIFDQELWHSPHHHSDFSNLESELVLSQINQSISESAEFLKKTSHVIITLGTAWVYHHIETDKLVANCHKIPHKQFVKRLLSVDEIVESMKNSIQLLKEINPKIQILFTISPVRHLKDGMQNNALSKAHLLTSVHHIVDLKNSFYFPSYEILMDDLRDYRFYERDRVHPNEEAVDYIWELFRSIWFAPKTIEIMNEVAQLQRDMNHRAFHPQSENHQKFLKNIEERKKRLKEKFGIEF